MIKRLPLINIAALSLLAPTAPVMAQSDAATSGAPAAAGATVPAGQGVMELGTMQVQGGPAAVPRESIDGRTGTASFHLDQQAIDNLPQGRNAPLKDLLLQAPGVAQDTFGQLHVRGDHGDIQYRVNGIILPESIGGFGNAFGTRFIDHLDFLTGTLPAEYGYRTAGVVNIGTKDGSRNGGSVSLYGGSYDTVEPSLEYGGSAGNFNYYLTGTYLQNSFGIEPPTPAPTTLHDETKQARAFTYLSYTVQPGTQVGLMAGHFLGNFQIPNVPGESAAYPIPGVTTPPSSAINENQREVNDYGVLFAQGLSGALSWQVSLFDRYSSVHYYPDPIADLVYNGVSSQVLRRSLATGLQADMSYATTEAHTLRWGLFVQHEHTASGNTAMVFPADTSGNPTSTTPLTVIDNTAKNGTYYSAYIEDQWLPLTALTVDYGLRYDLNDGYAREDQLSPRLNAVYAVTPATSVHAGYARYFTPPPLELIAPTDIALFQGTTNALPSNVNASVKAERDDYYDVGISHQITAAWQVGVDAYYKDIRNLLDEGQFGQAQIFSPFNYARGRVWGVQLTTGYRRGNFSSYFNVAASRAEGKDVVSGQYNFDPAELAYIASHYVHLDHDQLWTASGALTYRWHATDLSATAIYGSGLRRGFANSEALPAYTVVSLGAQHTFRLPAIGALATRFSIVNLFDQVYELRDGTGIGVGAAHYGMRRGFFAGITKAF